MSSYPDRILELEVERAALVHELAHAPREAQGQLRARLASVDRSLRWYHTRLQTRTPGAARAQQEASA